MNKKEIAEIKKQLSPTRQTITRICGCYVSAEKEKITTFSQSFGILEEEEVFKYLDIFKKSLSGTLGKNLLNMEFPNESEEEGGTQQFLYDLRQSHLEDDALLEEFYDKVIDSYLTGESYLILLITNAYDVPGKGTDQLEMFDASDEVYDYFQAVICPVDLAKPALSYDRETQSFRSLNRQWIVGMPMLGFLFPAFNDRGNDIHSVLYYSKDSEDLHFDFTDRLLGCRLPLSAGLQKEAFQQIVEQSLGENCSFEAVKEIHDTLREAVEEAKDEPDPVSFDKHDVKVILNKAGIRDEDLQDFDTAYDENVGEEGKIQASNVTAKTKLEIHTPDISIRISPDRSDLIEERIIDGRRCLVIPITDELTVNGIRISQLS